MDTELHEALSLISSRLDRIDVYLSDPNVGVMSQVHTLKEDLRTHAAVDDARHVEHAEVITGVKVVARQWKVVVGLIILLSGHAAFKDVWPWVTGTAQVTPVAAQVPQATHGVGK